MLRGSLSKDLALSSSSVPAVLALTLFGCSSNGSQSTAGSNLSAGDADFSVCVGSPAVAYTPGMSVTSASGAYRAALSSAVTTATGAAPVPTAGIGYDTFTVSVTSASDAGDDTGVPDGLTVTSTSLPWMPVHMHGASTLPTVTAQGGGTFSVADIDFFMGGYWQLPLNLVPASGAADPVVFLICIPDN
jgi:hypothetical protein